MTSKSSSIGLRRYYICLGALPLLYPAAPPSVFAYFIGSYTAPAVALGREYVAGFIGDIFGGDYGLRIFLDERRLVALLEPHCIRGLSFWHCLWIWQSTCRAAFSRYSICLGALPLLYPAASPSVFACEIGKYTAPAVALVREYVVGFLGDILVEIMVCGFS